jgi:hypothetical protein
MSGARPRYGSRPLFRLLEVIRVAVCHAIGGLSLRPTLVGRLKDHQVHPVDIRAGGLSATMR